MNRGFSFASVILSYFLVAGGLLLGLLIQYFTKFQSEYALYALFGVGSLIGGFVAARASVGSTILEPAIGAVLLVASVVGSVALTKIGPFLWHLNPDAIGKSIAFVSLASLGGAIVGAFISEKVLGEATESSVPWILYSALSAFGACFLAFVLLVIAMADKADATEREAAVQVTIGVGIGCLLCGLAVGASARTRPLLASFLGSAIGVGGFMAVAAGANGARHDQDFIIGAVVFSIGGGIVGLIGSALGWAMFGKKNAATA